MIQKILIADSSTRDVQRFQSLIEDIGLNIEQCSSGAELARYLDSADEDLLAIILSWELPGPPFGPELLVSSRRLLDNVPVVIVSNTLDASLATRAFRLGASDILEKPLDIERAKTCLNSILKEEDFASPLIENLNAKILGKSPALLSMLKQIAKIIESQASRILLVGESGTGKELIAQSIHNLSPLPNSPLIGVNVAAIPKELIESELFGHEQGAFTGASNLHRGYMEESGEGTLFLDEIGELDLSLQVKLLRVLQENKFRRLKGNKEIDFRARVISATNRDLTQEVKQGTFRRDLYHRITEVTIQVPSLHERTGDIDLLLDYFLSFYSGERQVRLARETLSILRSYTFPGNVRELENIIKGALIESTGAVILPQHLPLSRMGDFLNEKDEVSPTETSRQSGEINKNQAIAHQALFLELERTLPENWREMPYKKALEYYERAFDRIYLPSLIKRHHHNITKATKAAGVDKKTFAQHWKNAELPSLRGEEEKPNE